MLLTRFSAAHTLIAGLTLATALSACSTDTSRYPSLARREAERMTGSAKAAEPEVTPPATPAPPPAGLPDRLATISDAADAAHATFLEREVKARKGAKIGAGAEPGTLEWSEAEVSLSSLESARSDTMFALADLDSLLTMGAVSEADSGVPAGLAEIEEVRERVAGLVAAEDAVLAELRGR